MKILVVSDTHGKLNRVRDIWPKLTDIDLIIHAGDYISDAEKLEAEVDAPVIAVPGNCDGNHSENDFEIVKTEYGKILVTHGHMENVKFNLDNVVYKAMENGCKAAVFGHTHESCILESRGIYLVNPGSLTLPRDGSGGSYAIIRTAESNFDASIVYYSTVMGEGHSPTRTKSGFLRSILNYSDRL